MFKLTSLNLYRYNDWNSRKDNIIGLVNEQRPDFIAMQEVLTNHAFSEKPQSDFIADACGYRFRVFAPTLERDNGRDRDNQRTQHISEGQAFLSKYPIVTAESYFLKQYSEYPESVTVLFVRVVVNEQEVTFCNVHFANNDIAYKHLDELLMLIESRHEAMIIVGDFNIYKLADYKKMNKELLAYAISSETTDYISYPDDKDTLDYIAVDASKYALMDVACHESYVSDHRAISADINMVH